MVSLLLLIGIVSFCTFCLGIAVGIRAEQEWQKQ
jgi:hypothetical protein